MSQVCSIVLRKNLKHLGKHPLFIFSWSICFFTDVRCFSSVSSEIYEFILFLWQASRKGQGIHSVLVQFLRTVERSCAWFPLLLLDEKRSHPKWFLLHCFVQTFGCFFLTDVIGICVSLQNKYNMIPLLEANI